MRFGCVSWPGPPGVGDGGYAMTKPFWELDPRTHAHGALMYRSEQEYLSAVVPFLAHGLDLGQALWTAAPARHLRALRSALGTPPALRLVDSRDWYTKPSAPLAGYLSFIEGQMVAGRSVRIAGELVWPWAIAAAREWARYESILNVVLEGLPVQVFCTYNSRLAGYRLPISTATSGWGLWLARRRSDLVEVGTGRDGTAVRLSMQRPGELSASPGLVSTGSDTRGIALSGESPPRTERPRPAG
jgi:hypothetical protein